MPPHKAPNKATALILSSTCQPLKCHIFQVAVNPRHHLALVSGYSPHRIHPNETASIRESETPALPPSSSLVSAMLPLRHIPGLFVASTQTFGGQASFFNPKWCIDKYGLPERIASSKAAQTMMIVSSARMSALGIAMFVFHWQQKYEAVDMLLIILGGYVGLVDGYVAWIEGIPKRTVFRFTAGLLVAAWGWFGMHSGR